MKNSTSHVQTLPPGPRFEEGFFIERTRSGRRSARQLQHRELRLELRAVCNLRMHYIEHLQLELRERAVLDVARFRTIATMRSVTIAPVSLSNGITQSTHTEIQNQTTSTNDIPKEFSHPSNSKREVTQSIIPGGANEELTTSMGCRGSTLNQELPGIVHLSVDSEMQLPEEHEVERGDCTHILYKNDGIKGTALRGKQSDKIERPSNSLELNGCNLEDDCIVESIVNIKPTSRKFINSSASAELLKITSLEEHKPAHEYKSAAMNAPTAAPKHVTFSHEVCEYSGGISRQSIRSRRRPQRSHLLRIEREHSLQLSEVEFSERRTWHELLPVTRTSYLKRVTSHTCSFVLAAPPGGAPPEKSISLQKPLKSSSARPMGTLANEESPHRALVNGEHNNRKAKECRSEESEVNGAIDEKAKSRVRRYAVSLTVLLEDFRKEARSQVPIRKSEFRTFIICSS